MDDLRVSRASVEDAAELFPLVTGLATSFSPTEETFRRSLGDLASREDTWVGVARRGGAVVGYLLGSDHLTFHADGRVTWVEELAVADDHRRTGVGRRLMEELERWAHSRGAKLVSLATRRAAPFYRAIGYEESAAYFRRVL